jgi:hypothetical protein
MSAAQPVFYAKARSETAALFNYDLACLTPDQSLRLDCAVALRLALDDLQGRVVRGESIDVARMLTASEALARLLPPAVLAAPPPEHRADPRQVMWQIYKQMRERGEINLKPLPPEDHFQHRIAELEAENAALKSEKNSPGTRLILCDDAAVILPPSGTISSTAALPDVIDPPTSDIVPPCERAECDAGPRAFPDDPPRRSPQVIDVDVPMSPKPPTARPPQTWDDTAGGKAWQAWHDAGGNGGGDPWANNNR